jgi:hypothetical protein
MSGTQATNFPGAPQSAFDCGRDCAAAQFLCHFQTGHESGNRFRATTRKPVPFSASKRIHLLIHRTGYELLRSFADILFNNTLVIQTPMTNRED